MSSACNPFPQQSLQSTARRDLVMLPLTVQTVITCRLPLVCTFLTWFLNFSAKASVLMPFMHNYVLNHSFLFLAVSLLAFPFWDVTLDSHSLKEDRLNLAHGFRAFSSWLATKQQHDRRAWWTKVTHLTVARKQSRRLPEKKVLGGPHGVPKLTSLLPTQRSPEVCFTSPG